MAMDEGFAEVNGTRLGYTLAGSGPAVVFIHGLTLDRRMWDDQLPVFAQRFRTLTYDLRGFGRSAPPELDQPYTHAADLQALLTHAGIERAAIIGLSLGGRIAQEFALAYPGMVTSLTLVDSAMGGFQFSPEFSAVLGALYGLGREGRVADAKAGWVASPLFASALRIPDVAARLGRMVDEYDGWGLRNIDPLQPFDPPSKDRLHEIAARTLVIVGEHDIPDFHALSDELAYGIPNARKLVLANAGHMANMEAPAAFNDAVLRFVGDGC